MGSQLQAIRSQSGTNLTVLQFKVVETQRFNIGSGTPDLSVIKGGKPNPKIIEKFGTSSISENEMKEGISEQPSPLEVISDKEDAESEGNQSIGEERQAFEQNDISNSYSRIVHVGIG